MNLQNWINDARKHWKEFLPSRYKAFEEAGILEAELKDAAERTFREMDALERSGLRNDEAWEMVRGEYLFLPPEAAVKARENREPVSDAAMDSRDLTRIKSMLLGQ